MRSKRSFPCAQVAPWRGPLAEELKWTRTRPVLRVLHALHVGEFNLARLQDQKRVLNKPKCHIPNTSYTSGQVGYFCLELVGFGY